MVYDVIVGVLVFILWVSISILLIRDMNDADGDAAEWGSLPWYWKLGCILVGPIIFIIFERHILEKS